MKLPGLKSRVSFGLPGFAGLPTVRSGRHSSPGLKAWGFLAGFINKTLGNKIGSVVVFNNKTTPSPLSSPQWGEGKFADLPSGRVFRK